MQSLQFYGVHSMEWGAQFWLSQNELNKQHIPGGGVGCRRGSVMVERAKQSGTGQRAPSLVNIIHNKREGVFQF